jgi:hypothetical protein
VSVDPAAVLRHFHSITRSQIELDQAAWSRGIRLWVGRGFDWAVTATCSVRDAATRHHERLCRAAAFYYRKSVPTASRLYITAAAADAVAELAVEAAYQNGRLAELDRLLADIRTRAGLGEDDDWPCGEEPDDYRAASAESDALQQKVYNDTFTKVLRRYGFNAVARLYQNNRARYDELFERGCSGSRHRPPGSIGRP